MTLKRATLILALILLTAASLQACAPAEDNSADVIATSVAATLSANQGGEVLVPTDFPAETETAEEPNFIASGVGLIYNEILAESLSAETVPGWYEADNPWWSTPEHREFLFNGWVLADGFHPPAIRIYPVEDFRAINENVSKGLDALQLALETHPADYAGLAVSDMFNAGQLYQSNVIYLNFQNGSGARWLAQYGQAYSTVGWPNLFYTYQGLTDDGLYYVSIILPVNHPYLPDVDLADLDESIYEDYGAYRDAVVAQLESESDNTFYPSLVLLDQLVESLIVGNP